MMLLEQASALVVNSRSEALLPRDGQFDRAASALDRALEPRLLARPPGAREVSIRAICQLAERVRDRLADLPDPDSTCDCAIVMGAVLDEAEYVLGEAVRPLTEDLRQALPVDGDCDDEIHKVVTATPDGVLRVLAAAVAEALDNAPPVALTPTADARLLDMLAGRVNVLDATSQLDREPVPLAHVDAHALRAVVGSLSTLAAHRLIRWLAETVLVQTELRLSDPGLVTISGGYSALASEIGCVSKKDANHVRDLLRLGQHLHVEWGAGELFGLWTYVALGPAQDWRLEVSVSPALRPGFVHRTGEHALIPLPPLPPLVPRPREHAAQASMQMELVTLLHQRRIDLVRYGGALVRESDFERCARRVGLPRRTMDRLLDRWLHDGDDGPAMLERIGAKRYHLAPNATFRASREFLTEAGRRSVEGSRRGKASARRRRARSKRGAPGREGHPR